MSREIPLISVIFFGVHPLTLIFLSSPSPFTFISTGLIVGMYISSVMASVIQGAVNTVIVCYADAPSKLIEDHPKLTAEMEDAWSVLTPPPRPANNTNEEIEPLTI